MSKKRSYTPSSPKNIKKKFNKHNYDIEKMMECPVCMEFMTPPIWQCVSGHPLCDICSKKVNTCPTCRVDMEKKVRNFLAESILSMNSHFCQYSRCGQSVAYCDKRKHEETCVWALLTCHKCEKVSRNDKDIIDHLLKCEQPIRHMYCDGDKFVWSLVGKTNSEKAKNWETLLTWRDWTFLLQCKSIFHGAAQSISIYLIHQGHPPSIECRISIRYEDIRQHIFVSQPRSYHHYPIREGLDCLVIGTKMFCNYPGKDNIVLVRFDFSLNTTIKNQTLLLRSPH